MYPILMSHGGLCCGAKQLYGFHAKPTEFTTPVTKKQWQQYVTNKVTFGRWQWVEGQVRETFLNRLKRQLRHVRNGVRQSVYVRAGNRGIGQMLEAVLTDRQRDQLGWGKVFEELGFKPSVQWTNCNSENGLTTYHLYIDADYTAANVEEPAETKATPTKDPFAIDVEILL